MRQTVRVETYFGRVTGVDIDIVYEDDKKKIMKDMFGCKVLEKADDYYIVTEMYSDFRDIPKEQLMNGKFYEL